MKNFDTPTADMTQIIQNVYNALGQTDDKVTEEAMNAFGNALAEQSKNTAKNEATALYAAIQDEQILVSRGVHRAITSKEMKYFNEAVERQKIDGLDTVFPTTIIETVMTNLAEEHPLLSAIDVRTTEAVIKFIYGDPAVQTAYWDVIPSDIRQILIGAFKSLDIAASKLSGYIALAKGYFQLGPVWLANYVTTFLEEVMQATLEAAVVNGDGKLKPIGMMRRLSGSVDGVYPEKTAVAISDLTPMTLAGPRALLAQEKMLNGEIAFIVNPVTRETKISPNLFFQNTVDGSWKQLPLPNNERIIPSYAVPENMAILGNPKNYLLAVAGSLDLTKYDQTLAIEDMDLYIAKMFAAGIAKNPNAFIVLDLTGVTGATVPDADPDADVESQDTISPIEPTPEP